MAACSIKVSGKRQRIHAEGLVSSKQYRSAHAHQYRNKAASTIDELYQQGSARIRFPRTQPGALQAVLLNTAGGLTGDDRIQWSASAGKQSHLVVSTAACEKIYRTHGPAAVQNTTLQIAENARLEWLPQESILFNGSYLERSMHVKMEENATALIVESLVIGRQAMNESTDSIRVHDRWRIHQGNHLLHAEDFRLDMTNGTNAHRQCVLHHFSAISTLVLITDQHSDWCESMLTQIRHLVEVDADNIRVGASALPSRIVVRVLASNSFHLRKFLIRCIELLNDGRAIPAVWNV